MRLYLVPILFNTQFLVVSSMALAETDVSLDPITSTPLQTRAQTDGQMFNCDKLLGQWQGQYNLLAEGLHVEWYWHWWADGFFEGELTYSDLNGTSVEFLAGAWVCDGHSYTNQAYFSSQIELDPAIDWTIKFYFEELNHSYMRTRVELDADEWEVFEAIRLGD